MIQQIETREKLLELQQEIRTLHRRNEVLTHCLQRASIDLENRERIIADRDRCIAELEMQVAQLQQDRGWEEYPTPTTSIANC